MRTVCLMYHDVHEGEAPTAGIAAGATRYHVSADAFRRHLAILRRAWEAGTVSLTFDDGWAGSLSTGVECLLAAGMQATFFVTRDFVGKRHFADATLLREARAAGMEIGTHGATHRFLSTLPAAEAREELAGAKAYLEDLLGSRVTTGSVPGGAWSGPVRDAARGCGYEALYTSRPGLNDESTDRLALRRIAVRRGTAPAEIERYARLRVGREVARASVLGVPRAVLGRERYAALRGRLLG